VRIGIDFDGVLADVVRAKIAFALERFGVTLEPHETWRADAIERIGFERYNGMLRDLFGTARTLDIAPIAGALEVSNRLAEQHELIVLTARTDEERGPAEAWIRQHEVPISRFIHTSREPKPPVCAALGIDVLLDDWETNFIDMREETVSVLLDAPHNTHVEEPHITRVEDWLAFEQLVRDLDER
jgi:5'(3')-deoxyribonucleotidase